MPDYNWSYISFCYYHKENVSIGKSLKDVTSLQGVLSIRLTVKWNLFNY